jgi:paraquat-inducible protein B
VDGLIVGSPLKLEGVKVGTVTDIHIEWDVQAAELRIPVTVEIVAGSGRAYGGGQLVLTGTREERAKRLIDRGMRASLATESFITGQLAIVLDFHPGTPVRLVGGDLPYPELPTVRSGLSKVLKDLSEIPIKQIFLDAQKTIRDIDARVDSEDVTRAIRSVSETLDQYKQLGAELNGKVGPLVDSIESTSDEARKTFSQGTETLKSLQSDVHDLKASLDKTLEHVRTLVDDVDTELKPTAADLRAALKSVRDAAARVDVLLRDDSPTITELKRALVEIAGAARAFKSLAETLREQPESLLRGKRGN